MPSQRSSLAEKAAGYPEVQKKSMSYDLLRFIAQSNRCIKVHHNLSNWNFVLHCALFRACLEPLDAFTCDMREIQSSQSSQPRRHGLTTLTEVFSLEFSSALDEGFVRLTATRSHLGLREVHCHPLHPIASLESDLTEQGEQSLEKSVPAESLPVPLSEGDGTVGIGQLG